MSFFTVKPASCIKGVITLKGDKSIACRGVIISAIALGETKIENFPSSKDCIYAIRALRALGIQITPGFNRDSNDSSITVHGQGPKGLKRPAVPIFIGDSGTTLRLILGVLAGQNFKVKLTAGKSLSRRPMRRVTEPLRLMGADIYGRRSSVDGRVEEYAPIVVRGGNLKPIIYKLPVASAQVKSAILLAGLYAQGATKVVELVETRDHTERMLKLFKADIKVKQNTIVITRTKGLISPKKLYIPGDISSASFFIVLALILPDSEIVIRNVSLNPTRMGLIKVLRRMGADIRIKDRGLRITGYEPMGDIAVRSSKLKRARVKRKEIPSLIDELPILMVAASYAQGKSIFEGVGELRVKETDRIRSMFENLKKMQAEIRVAKTKEREDIIIEGVKELIGTRVISFGDHRTAMSMVIAGLKAKGKTSIDDVVCINKSFPDFLDILRAHRQ